MPNPQMLNRLPQHVAIIMDGNGRWAKQRRMPRIAGHKAGVDAIHRIVTACVSKPEIKALSLFAFSQENWRRPISEVNDLMDLFLHGLDGEIKVAIEKNVRLRFIGSRSQLCKTLQNKIQKVETSTLNQTGMQLIIAVDYGGRWDIMRALHSIAKEIEEKVLSSQDIGIDLIGSRLSLADLPDPDLLIRTSGEQRLSDFMLWQLRYTELYFTPTLWPDFTESDLEKAFADYADRERRFGYNSEQLADMITHKNP